MGGTRSKRHGITEHEPAFLVGYNYQEYRYPDDHTKYPSRIIYGSENGHALAAWNAVAQNEYISGQYLWTGIDYLGEARGWPSRSNGAGLIDLAGFPKSEFYFRQSLWIDTPMIFVGTATVRGGGGGSRRNMMPAWNSIWAIAYGLVASPMIPKLNCF